MSDEITEAIKKLELYREQIKAQAKKEILTLVDNRDDDYFKWVRLDEEDGELKGINYRLNSLQEIQNLITFLKINYDRGYKEKLLRDIRKMPVFGGEEWDCGPDEKLIG